MHMHILSALLEMYIPELDSHLRNLGVSWDMLTAKFIMTLCSSYIPLEFLASIYDIFFLDGWIGLYKFVIAFLNFYKKPLCEKDLSSLSEYLRKIRETITLTTIKRIQQNALDVHIKKDAIEYSISTFFQIQAEKMLSGQERDWPSVYITTLAGSVKLIEKYKNDYQKDASYLQRKIEDLDNSIMKYLIF